MRQLFAFVAVILACMIAPIGASTAAAQAKPPPKETPAGIEGPIEIRTGMPMQRLPFDLHLDNSGPPQSIDAVEAALYDALPEEHLAFIAAYLGSRGHCAVRRRYRSPIDLRSALHAREIMAEAWRQWGFDSSNDPFAPLIECVGPRFSHYLTLRLGFRYIRQEGRRVDTRSDVLRAFRELESATQRLFELCERQRPQRGGI